MNIDPRAAELQAQRPPVQVTSWFKQIGCKVTPVKQHPEGAAFTAALLTGLKCNVPLLDCLPAIRPGKRRRKT